MKNLIIPILFAFPQLAFAQHQQDQKLSPEQRATLQAKKMALHLDLSQAQERQALAVFKNHFEAQAQKHQKEAQEDPYQKALQRLEHQQALQQEMAKILNEKQYASWKERHEKQAQKMHKKRRQHGAKKQGKARPHAKHKSHNKEH